MPASSTKSRLLAVLWCVLVPLGVVAAYLGLGVALVTAIGEPILGTAVLGACVVAVVGAVRLLRPRWLAHAPQAPAMTAQPRFGGLVAAGTVLAFLAGQSLALWLYQLAGSAGFDESVRTRQETGPAVTLLLVLVVAPVAEELLFRGLLYPLLRRRLGIVVSAAVTTAVFGIMHGNAVQFASALPLALLLALLYERTRVLWPCVLIHLGFNLAATFVPAPALAGLANPVSALLLTTAFLGCAYALYRRIAKPATAVLPDAGADEEHEGRAA